MSKRRKKAIVKEVPKTAYHFSYCSGCGSQKMIKGKCQVCGYVRKGPIGSKSE